MGTWSITHTDGTPVSDVSIVETSGGIDITFPKHMDKTGNTFVVIYTEGDCRKEMTYVLDPECEEKCVPFLDSCIENRDYVKEYDIFLENYKGDATTDSILPDYVINSSVIQISPVSFVFDPADENTWLLQPEINYDRGHDHVKYIVNEDNCGNDRYCTVTWRLLYNAVDTKDIICEKVSVVIKQAGGGKCCTCDKIELTPAAGSAFDVDYQAQEIFTLSTDPKCSMTFSHPSWITYTEIAEGVYKFYVEENTELTDRDDEIWVYDEDGDTCTSYKVTQHVNGVLLLPAFDYMTFVYRWSSSAGSDLDTATVVIDSGISSLDNAPVGYSCSGSDSKYLSFGGDNTQTGTESVCIYLSNIIEDCPETTEKITIRLYGNWWGEKGTGNISMEYYTYKDGTMTKPSIPGNLYTNVGGSLVSDGTANVYVGIESKPACNLSEMSLIGTLVYNIKSKTTIFTTT